MASEKRLIDVSKWDGYYTARKQSLEVYDPYYDGYEDALDHVDDWMNARPTVDAVPVVRCKDCKYWQDNNGGHPHEECRWGKGETPDETDFCSYGERKDNG